MKNILTVLVLGWAAQAMAVCSSPISRTSSGPNTVLTSTKYNLDLSTVYTRVNELPGDCITDGTVTSTKLDTSTLAPLVKGVKEGCLASRSDANTISISKCLIAVNGNLIEKTTATTVTWACSGCTAEAASTRYYVYATSASTLTLLLSTTAPDAVGYSGTSRVLASFYNNASSDIDSLSIDQWVVSSFVPQPGVWASFTPATSQGLGTLASVVCFDRRDGADLLIRCRFVTGTVDASEARLGFRSGLVSASSSVISTLEVAGHGARGSADYNPIALIEPAVAYLTFSASNSGTVGLSKQAGNAMFGTGVTSSVSARVPIAGWSY